MPPVQEKKKPPGWINAASGGCSAMVSRTCVSPLERLRMQMITDAKAYGGSNSAVLKTIYKNEGITGFWRGNGINMFRIFPQNAMAFFAKPFAEKNIKPIIPNKSAASITASAVGGMACITFVYPLDIVRGRVTTTPGVYKGMVDGLMQIGRAEGLAGLYKGCSHANIWAIPYYIAMFQTYEILKGFSQSQGIEVGPGLGLVFGMCAGVSSTSCAFPFESVRRKLQVQGVGGRPVLYKGIFSGLAGCIKTNGVMSVYEGCFANCIKMAPAQAITFSCIEIFKPLMLTLAGYD